MKRKVLGIIKYLLFLGLGVFLVWWQLSKMTKEETEQFTMSLKHARYWLLIPVVIMAILSHMIRAIRWKVLIEPMGYSPSVLNAFYCVMTGYLINTFVPRAGEILKCTLLSRYEKIPTNKLIGTILIERTFDMLCYIVLILFTILVQIKFLSSFIREKFTALFHQTIFSGVMILLAISVLLLLLALIRLAFRKHSKHKYIIGLRGFYYGLAEGFKTIRHLKKRKQFLTLTFLMWTMYLLQIYVGFSALSETSDLNLIHACSVLTLATLAMIVSPGGMGAFPLAVQQILLLYNHDNISFGWLMWGVSTAIVVVGGLISFVLLLYKNKPYYEAKPTGLQ